ncbi:hypothetical protein KC19_VG324700 [Ceratodon purpureus]|uniref:Secreted protein n=1 Tax=Ceratodon purpureus TaxID=3225 RepID=A0A8T0HXI9_CERPU|nr:hypothetical protein KC19_VG324700 [Ceratodon purpureus]
MCSWTSKAAVSVARACFLGRSLVLLHPVVTGSSLVRPFLPMHLTVVACFHRNSEGSTSTPSASPTSSVSPSSCSLYLCPLAVQVAPAGCCRLTFRALPR